MDLLRRTLYLLYMVGGFYSLIFSLYVITSMIGRAKQSLSGAVRAAWLSDCAVVICIVTAILSPARWYAFIYQPCIPDGTYNLNVLVAEPGASRTYRLPADITLYTDSEEAGNTDDDPDLLRNGSAISYLAYTRTCYIYRAYWPSGGYLTFDSNITPGAEVRLSDHSSQAGMTKYNVTLPPFTSEDLGVTPEEKFHSIGIVSLAELVVVTLCACVGAVFCIIAHKKEEDPS